MNKEIMELRQELERKYGMCFIFVMPDGILFQVNNKKTGEVHTTLVPFQPGEKEIEVARKAFKAKLEKKVEQKTTKKGPSRKSGSGSGDRKSGKADS